MRRRAVELIQTARRVVLLGMRFGTIPAWITQAVIEIAATPLTLVKLGRSLLSHRNHQPTGIFSTTGPGR